MESKSLIDGKHLTRDLVGCLLLALVVLGTSMTLKVLNPLFIDWCLNWDSDLSNYYLAFAYYRHSAWSFPNITHIGNLFHPVGADIVLMDGLPLVSVPLKVVQRLLPERFQFFGLWLLVCHWLQAFVGLRFLRELKVSLPLAWCGAILLCLAPPLIWRHGHTQLCAHFLLLASMLAAVSARPSWLLIAIPTLAVWIHAYWVVMCLPFLAVGHLRFIRDAQALRRVCITGASFVASLWILGYFSMHATQSRGYGEYVSDLATFFNPMGFSAFLPQLPQAERAQEGMAYLGIGGLALVVPCFVGLGAGLTKELRVAVYSVTAICAALALYAISTKPQLLGQPVAEFPTLSHLLQPITSRFRAGGRFVWPLYYLVLIFGVKGVDWLLRERPRLTLAAALGLVLMQSADVGLAYAELGRNSKLTERSDFNVPDSVREQLTADSRYLIFSPPVKVGCKKGRWRGNYYAYALFGAEHGLITNSDFGQARMSSSDRREVCQSTGDLVDTRPPDVIVVEQ